MKKDIVIDAAGDNLKFWEFRVDTKNHPTMHGAKGSKESHGVTHVAQSYKGELENYGEMYMTEGYVQNHSSICEVGTNKETHATMHESESNMERKDAINLSGGNMNNRYTMCADKGHTQTHDTMRAVEADKEIHGAIHAVKTDLENHEAPRAVKDERTNLYQLPTTQTIRAQPPPRKRRHVNKNSRCQKNTRTVPPLQFQLRRHEPNDCDEDNSANCCKNTNAVRTKLCENSPGPVQSLKCTNQCVTWLPDLQRPSHGEERTGAAQRQRQTHGSCFYLHERPHAHAMLQQQGPHQSVGMQN